MFQVIFVAIGVALLVFAFVAFFVSLVLSAIGFVAGVVLLAYGFGFDTRTILDLLPIPDGPDVPDIPPTPAPLTINTDFITSEGVLHTEVYEPPDPISPLIEMASALPVLLQR